MLIPQGFEPNNQMVVCDPRNGKVKRVPDFEHQHVKLTYS